LGPLQSDQNDFGIVLSKLPVRVIAAGEISTGARPLRTCEMTGCSAKLIQIKDKNSQSAILI
jgi:hypothetical protein